MKLIVLCLTLMLTPPASAQQYPPDGSLEGFVVRLGIADPIVRAEVVLAGEGNPAVTLRATTDAGGRYRFDSVPPGTYRLNVTRDGFVRAAFGQRGPTSQGTTITLGQGQNLTDVIIAMTPTGAIAGRVYDQYGDPVVRARVQAMRYVFKEGQRTLAVVETAQTNDLGEYRLFWMQPGQYVVSAVPTRDLGLKQVTIGTGTAGAATAIQMVRGVTAEGGYRLSGNNLGALSASPASEETYVPVYYPGSPDPAAAAPIDLRPGADYTGVDMMVVETRTVSIRGRVINGVTSRMSGISVRLIPRGSIAGGPQNQRTARVSETGEFEIPGIAPGTYDLIASLGSQTYVSVNTAGETTVKELYFQLELPEGPDTGSRIDRGADDPRLGGVVTIDVGNADVENVTIPLQAGVDISGHVRIDRAPDAEADPDPGRVRVFLRPEPAISQLTPVPTPTSPDGTFTVAGVIPFDYRVTVSGLEKNHYIRSVRLGDTDILNSLLRLDGPPRGTMEVIVGTDSGSVDAIVRDDRQDLVPGVRVVLVPDPARRFRSELFRTATTDAEGRIHIEGIAPGDYSLFAWEEVEEGAWQDPDFLRTYEPLGRTVRIGPNGWESVELRLIPYR